MKDEYDLPKEIKDIFEDAQANKECAEKAITSCFRWKRAAYFMKMKRGLSKRAWSAVNKLYPELSGTSSHFNHDTGKVHIEAPKEQ